MDRDPAVRREFIRRVYRAAALAGQPRSSYLDGLSDAANEGAIEAGKELTASADGGVSASYQLFSGYSTFNLLRLIDWARSFIDYATVDLAVAAVLPGVKRTRLVLTNLRC